MRENEVKEKFPDAESRKPFIGKTMTLVDFFSARRNELSGRKGTIIGIDGCGDFEVEVAPNDVVTVMVGIDSFEIDA